MKQVRPLKDLWGNKNQVGAEYKKPVSSNGIVGGRKSRSTMALRKRRLRGAKELTMNFAGHR